MKTQIITITLLVATLSLTSCKNSETPVTETQVSTAAAQVDSTMQTTVTVSKDSIKSKEKEESEENEKNEK